MLGRDSRTLSKLFEEIVNSPDEYDKTLTTAKDILAALQRKFIVGLK